MVHFHHSWILADFLSVFAAYSVNDIFRTLSSAIGIFARNTSMGTMFLEFSCGFKLCIFVIAGFWLFLSLFLPLI